MKQAGLVRRFIKKCASLQLAVFTILLMGLVIAIGTFVEAKYQDAEIAAKLVYKTPWMIGIMVVFALNLMAVMADRWPWKRRHLSFLLAHVGILVLLVGSWVTMKWGLDGSMRVGLNESNRFVMGPETEITVWSSFDGQRFSKVFSQDVDFWRDPPERKPVSFMTDEGELKFTAFEPYVLASRRAKAGDPQRSGSGLQFSLRNDRVQVQEWMIQSKPGTIATHDFGPAKFHLGVRPTSPKGFSNEVFLEPVDPLNASSSMRLYQVGRDGELLKDTVIKLGETFQTGWMGLELKLLQYMPVAEWTWDFQKTDQKTELTNASVQFEFMGQQYNLQKNDVIKIFTEKAVYYVSFANKRVDIGFDIHLKQFNLGRYPGTMRAASYESLVDVPELGEALISMNEPLKYKGLTIYQASFQEDKLGQVEASIFSVNHDPGRWIKYLGSLILSLGVVVLFYDRRKASRAQLGPKKWEDPI